MGRVEGWIDRYNAGHVLLWASGFGMLRVHPCGKVQDSWLPYDMVAVLDEDRIDDTLANALFMVYSASLPKWANIPDNST